MKGGFYYVFDEKDNLDYEMKITYNASKKLYEFMFDKALTKLGYAEKIKKDNLTEFKIPDELKKKFFPMVKGSILPNWRIVMSKVKKDGIKLLSMYIKDIYFTQLENKDWKIDVVITGQMIRE